MPIELKVPEVGESISEVYIGTWLKAEGDTVEKDEALVEIETDKATLEVPAPASGTLSKVLKKEGDSANVGEVIAHVAEAGEADGAEVAADTDTQDTDTQDTAAQDTDTQDTGAQEAAAPPKADGGDAGERVMPAARRLLDENDLTASEVEATGPGGRLLKEDVLKHLEQRSTPRAKPAPEKQLEKQPEKPPKPPEKPEQADKADAKPAAPPKPGVPRTPVGEREEETVPMSPLRRRIALRLVEAQQTAALLTTFNEIDMSEVMALRNAYKEPFQERYGIRLGFMSFFVKATIDALKQIPQLNAEIRGSDIVYHNYFDIGVAVSSKKGLIVPVVRNAERLSFAELEEAIRDFGRRAQDNKLAPEELQGGTFTISNGGVFGSLMSTPIVNPPQSGVLGMHAIVERPVAEAGQVVIKPMMYVALTYDHRIVDGREAVTFLKRIKDAVERPARMLLEV